MGFNIDATLDDSKDPQEEEPKENLDESLRLQNDALRIKNEDSRSNLRLRKFLAYWAAAIVSAYLAFVMYLIYLCTVCGCHQSDAVLIALLGTTTTNVLGLMFIILRGLFGDKGKRNKKQRE